MSITNSSTLSSLLKSMVESNASDLHLTVGAPPCFRVFGEMTKHKSTPLSEESIKDLVYTVISARQKEKFLKNHELDFSFGIKDFARFRGNLFYQKGTVAAVFRQIPFLIPRFDELGLPRVLKKLIKAPNGLILVTGPTGSGKSTSLASMLDMLNTERQGHILTIEDPIEFIHQHKKCIVNQREVGTDTKSFKYAFREVLRQDPDYILIGELRDSETAEMALTMAETGHLVFATLHTNSCVQTVNRVISMFPMHQQQHIRSVLSFALLGVLSQQLIPIKKGVALACEMLIPNAAIQNLIRSDKVHQIYSVMQSGQETTHMQTMNQSLVQLCKSGIISAEEATMYTTVPDELRKLLGLKK